MSDVETMEEAGDLPEAKSANATNSQAFSLDQHDVELDYEPEDEEDVPKNDLEMEKISDCERDEDGFDDEKKPEDSINEISEKEKTDEELEEGELSDEDEEARKERLKPQPVCRFFSKGLCSWGESCRFVHPGVLDKGNYSMFAPPRPILPRSTPNEPELIPVENAPGLSTTIPTDDDPIRPARPETAWERGLRQAKEMKKLSQQRKETDSEYEEKRTALSLAQAELEKENDYYAKQASPLRDNDSNFGDDFDEFFPESFQPSTSSSGKRRIAPPPPQDFYPPSHKGPFYRNRNRNAPARRYPPSPPRDRFSMSPPPRVRRVAPPRSPREVDDDIREHHIPPPVRRRPADAWEDPWMRGGKADKDRSPGASKRRSYSSGSSRSSSRSSSTSRSRSRGYRGRSSSISSRSSSRSRSRSSTPKGIPRRNSGPRGRQTPPNRSPPPRQPGRVPPGLKRGHQQGPPQPLMKRIKQEPPDSKPKLLKPKIEKGSQQNDAARKKHSKSSSESSRSPSKSPPRKRKPSPRPAPKQPPPNIEPVSRPNRPPQEPPVRAPRTPPRKPEPPVQKQVRMTIKSNSVKPTPKSVLEKLGLNAEDEAPHGKEKEAALQTNKKKVDDDFEKLGKKSDHGKVSKATRREELLKQLKAVENAIAKKRTKYQETKPSSNKGRAS